jgi:ParB family chromosome partitioning protein
VSGSSSRRGLGRGLGSLIPTAPPSAPRGGDGADAARIGTATPTAPTAGSNGNGTSSGAPTSEADDSGTPATEAPATDGAGLVAVDGAYFAELEPTSIQPNHAQPRQVFDEEAMAELVHSVREIGLLQPIVVRPLGEDSYELIMGERRWRAAQEAGLERIPAIVRQTDDADMLRDALLENLHRAQLNPLEEASAYAQLLEDFGCTHDELAQRIGRSRPQISNTLRLLRLGPAVQRRVAAGVLSAGHARALLAVDDSEIQDRLAQRVVAEGISVRALEEIVAVGDNTRRTRTVRRKPAAPGLTELSDRLADRLETRVKIDLGQRKGKVTIEFANTGDLQRIIDLIDPRNRTDRPI